MILGEMIQFFPGHFECNQVLFKHIYLDTVYSEFRLLVSYCKTLLGHLILKIILLVISLHASLDIDYQLNNGTTTESII